MRIHGWPLQWFHGQVRAVAGMRLHSEVRLAGGDQARCGVLQVAKLGHEGTHDCFPELEWDSIAELTLRVSPRTSDLEVIRERHETEHLAYSQTSRTLNPDTSRDVLPMEGPDPRTWLCLERGRGAIGIEPEKEGPVPAPPLEVVASAVTVGVPKIVLASWHLGCKLSVRSIDDLIIGCQDEPREPLEGLGCGHVRNLARIEGP